jgi:tetratricopeptide (TPR) repeat protein
MSIRSIPARLPALVALGLVLGPACAPAIDYNKPRRPVTGEPTFNQPKDPAELLKMKEKAAKLYIEGLREAEKARGGLYRERQLKAMAAKDPESGEKAVRMRKYAVVHLKHAQEKFEHSVRLDAKISESWGQLGFTRLKLGDIAGALDALETALALKPSNYAARESRAEAYLAQGRIKDAREELDWLMKKGNMTTLETNNLQEAIKEWTAENAEPAKSGK